MEEVAQGRVWTGKAALEHGLVDTLGGISKAIAIAKQKAGIPEDQEVRKDASNFSWWYLLRS
jgi:protease-4